MVGEVGTVVNTGRATAAVGFRASPIIIAPSVHVPKSGAGAALHWSCIGTEPSPSPLTFNWYTIPGVVADMVMTPQSFGFVPFSRSVAGVDPKMM